MKILVVDDHHAAREGIRSLFSRTLETKVIEASSAAEALSLCRSGRPDVIVMDLNLPDIPALFDCSMFIDEKRPLAHRCERPLLWNGRKLVHLIPVNHADMQPVISQAKKKRSRNLGKRLR
jgi:ActR/RegA family two-component response regulator